jgi:hypothetical protein
MQYEEKKLKKLKDKKIDGLDIEKGLEKYEGNEEIYLKILRSYAASTRAILDGLCTANESNLHDYRLKFHSLKGTSLDIFAEKIGNAAAKLEEAAKIRNIDFLNTYVPRFIQYSMSVIDAVDKMLFDIIAGEEKPIKDKPDDGLLDKLLEYCEIYNMDGVDKTMDEIEKFKYLSDDGLAAWLREKSNMMEYSEIVERLS